MRKITDFTGTPEETRYVYQGWQVIAEADAAWGVHTTYVYGNYIDEVVNMQRGVSTDYWYFQDDLSSTVAVADDDGNVLERIEYGDYGRSPCCSNLTSNYSIDRAFHRPGSLSGPSSRADPEMI